VVLITIFLLIIILAAAIVPILRRRRIEARQRIIDSYTGLKDEDRQTVSLIFFPITTRANWAVLLGLIIVIVIYANKIKSVRLRFSEVLILHTSGWRLTFATFPVWFF
jgi:hypothetical protein